MPKPKKTAPTFLQPRGYSIFENALKTTTRDERSKEIGLSASGFCSRSNPSPGSKISTPEFGYELFVAQSKGGTSHSDGNRKLFTVIHQLFTDRWQPAESLFSASDRKNHFRL